MQESVKTTSQLGAPYCRRLYVFGDFLVTIWTQWNHMPEHPHHHRHHHHHQSLLPQNWAQVSQSVSQSAVYIYCWLTYIYIYIYITKEQSAGCLHPPWWIWYDMLGGSEWSLWYVCVYVCMCVCIVYSVPIVYNNYWTLHYINNIIYILRRR